MFGFGKRFAPDPTTRTGDMLPAGGVSSPNEKLMLLGAMLRDFGSGGQTDSVMSLQNALAARAKTQQRMAAESQLAQLLTSGGAGGGGVPTLRQALPSLLAARQAGVDIGDYVPLLDKAGPSLKVGPNGEVYDERDPGIMGRNFSPSEYVNGVKVNPNASDAPGFIPTMDKGQEPLYDKQGRIVAIRNMDGSVQAAAEMAGAVEGAKASAQAPYQDITLQGPDGRPITMSRQAFAGAGPIRGQSPAERIAAEGAAKNRVEGQAALPQAMQQAQLALDVIGQIRNHPGMKSRIGLGAVLPAIPGTPGKDFDTLVEQAKGQVFLQATQALRGLGPMTEQEGRAAQAALARLNQAQSLEGFNKALDDFERIIQGQISKARAQSGQGSIRPDRSAIEAELRRRGLIR